MKPTDSLKERLLECPKCKHQQKHYVWDSNLEKEEIQCVNNVVCKFKGVMGIITVEIGDTFSYIGMTPEQIKKDRKSRNSKHYKQEILPTIGRDSYSKKIFKKYGYNS